MAIKKEKMEKNKPKAKRSKQEMIEQAASETPDETTTMTDRDAAGGGSSKLRLSDMSVQQKCDYIAELSESIMESPETAFSAVPRAGKDEPAPSPSELHSIASGQSKMRQLLTLASKQSNPSDQYTAQLAIMSLLALYKDILPAYRIRPPTKQEMAIRVSKDTKKLWDYERAVLNHYQQYLQLLEKTSEGIKEESAGNSLAVTAILSLCELLKATFHFNFRTNLLTAVVRQMNNRQQNRVVGDACCQAVEYIFANDAQGDFSVEAVRQVCKMIKNLGFKIRAPVLSTFLALPLRVHDDEAQAAKLAAAANKKKRKKDKESAAIDEELKEGNASVDKIVLARCQSEMLHTVVLTYFRILKSDNLKAAHIEELLPAALAGLAKLAHLINIETVQDLLTVLKELLKKIDVLPLDAALNCVLTAFQALHGPGKEMKVDQKEYIRPIYSQLPRLCTMSNSLLHTDTVLKCLNAAFVKRREFSTVRIAAFLKQICTVCLHTPPHTSVPLLAFARQILQRYPSAHQMLENEEDVITIGQHNPDVEDPEHSNPLATSAWELATLRFHVHPQVSAQADAATNLKMVQLPAEGPEKLRTALLEDADELFIKFHRFTKKHPLEPKGGDKDNSNKKRKQARFITPRSTTWSLLEQDKIIPCTTTWRLLEKDKK
jgi:nucleolar complex protein 3